MRSLGGFSICCRLLSSGAGRGLSGTVAATVSREQRRRGGREQGGGGGGCCGRREVERPPDQPANQGLDIAAGHPQNLIKSLRSLVIQL